jgi:small-conductance mechanosensitive channel
MKLGDTTACLNGAGKTLGNYFTGGASDSEVSGLFDCASSALELFETRTRGEQPNQYSPDELRNFMQTYFLQGLTISDELLQQLKYLKQALVGGSADSLTDQDLDRLRSILDTLKTQSIAFKPYLPLTPEHLNQMQPADLEKAISVLKDTASILGKILVTNSVSYSFDNMDNLLLQSETFVQDSGQSSCPRLHPAPAPAEGDLGFSRLDRASRRRLDRAAFDRRERL